MDRNKDKERRRQARHWRLRRRISGTAARPRLAVYRSLHHIYAQLIDDEAEGGSRTLLAASTREAAIRDQLAGKEGDGSTGNAKAAATVGAVIADRAKAAGIKQVSFDRGGFRYHGRVKALADAARENGLEL